LFEGKAKLYFISSMWYRIAWAALLCVVALPPGTASPVPRSGPTAAATLRQASEGRHINIGTAAASAYLSEADYTNILGSEFSQLQAENEMKFGVIHPRPDNDPNPYNFKGGDALVAFAQVHGMVVRGHTLVWHNQVPKWVSEGNPDPGQLAAVLENHIHTVMTHYASKIYAWDVVNEAFNDDGTMRHTLWYDQPGIGAGNGTKYIEQVFRWAHDGDRAAKLFYNDYDAEVVNKKSDAIYDMVKDFKKHGVPVDGVGFQFHVSLKFDDAAKLESAARNLERFAKLGLELHITELDIRLNDSSPESLAAQAKLYGEITALCVQQPACKLIQTWGFTDKHSWIPQFYKGQGWALLWDDKYHKKPAYEAVYNALGK
jgi:endo-1,4-beta-xylanase